MIVLHPDEVTMAEQLQRTAGLQNALSRAVAAGPTPCARVRARLLMIRRLRRSSANILLGALAELDSELDELFVDDFVTRVAAGLAGHARAPARPLSAIAWRQANAAREYLEAHATRGVGSQELERVTGLDRFALSRHFRAAFATSPHRFLLMRRLQRARAMIAAGGALADVAAATGCRSEPLNAAFQEGLRHGARRPEHADSGRTTA